MLEESTDAQGNLISLKNISPLIRKVIEITDTVQRIADATFGQTWVISQAKEVLMSWQEIEIVVERSIKETRQLLEHLYRSPEPSINVSNLKIAQKRLIDMQDCIDGKKEFSSMRTHAYLGAMEFKRVVTSIEVNDNFTLVFPEPEALNYIEIWQNGKQVHKIHEPHPNRAAALKAAVTWGYLAGGNDPSTSSIHRVVSQMMPKSSA